MVNLAPSTESSQPVQTNSWVQVSWEAFLAATNDPVYEGCQFYCDHKMMRIEMAPLGSSHIQDDPLVARLISLFATLRGFRFKEISNGSFRKTGEIEFQPDIAFYIGSEVKFPLRGTAPIDLNEVEPPSLVVEIASTTLADDLGRKRLLYERIGISEYWVVDVEAGKVTAFEISNRHSGQIQDSVVLPGLVISVVEEALQRGQLEDDGVINRWLLRLFTPE